MNGLKVLLFVLLLTPVNAAGNLRLAAAANMSQILPEIITAFESSHPEIKISISYGASGTLCQQIERGAPYDVFIAASPKYIDHLDEAGLVAERRVFALGTLVLYYSNRLRPAPASLASLAKSRVKRVAIANPEHAPYGQAALACLHYYGVYEQVKDKLVYAANVSQAAEMALHGADAALIALPLARNPALTHSGGYLVLPADCHQPLIQEAAAITGSPEAVGFVEFLSSPVVRSILEESGYTTP